MNRMVLTVSVDKERERDLSLTELCHQHTETCCNAANQFGLKHEPHIFIDAQVFVTMFVFERSGGKSPDVILIMCNHGPKCIGVAAHCSQNYFYGNRIYSSGHSKTSLFLGFFIVSWCFGNGNARVL